MFTCFYRFGFKHYLVASLFSSIFGIDKCLHKSIAEGHSGSIAEGHSGSIAGCHSGSRSHLNMGHFETDRSSVLT